MAKNWKCPHCGAFQTLTYAQSEDDSVRLYRAKSRYGGTRVDVQAIACANPECGELWLQAAVVVGKIQDNGQMSSGRRLSTHLLRPRSVAQTWPDFIPTQIREDYEEACLIADLSPKASATLARRCLQGMIRDFCGIAKNRLVDEINELKRQVEAGEAPRGVEHETIEAIDAVRSVGNVGAHMEKDVNLLVTVDPQEAAALIKLLELLAEDWYMARAERQARLAAVKKVAADKDEAKKKTAAETSESEPDATS